MNSTSPRPRLSQLTRLWVLVGALPLSFLTFQFFPGMPLIQESWFVIMALTMPLVYLPWRLRNGIRLSSFEGYVILLASLIPIWSALAAQHEFGQPLLYGILAQRGMVMVVAVPLLTRMCLDRGWIQFKDLRDALVILAWATLALNLAMTLFLEPSSYFETYGLGFVSGPGKEAQFKFDVIFIAFGFYYYSFRGIRLSKWKDHLNAAFFLLFILLVIRGRSLLLALLGVYLILTIVWTQNKRHLVRQLLRIAISFGFIWILLALIAPEFARLLTTKFNDAFTVLLTGEMTDDPSANSRIQQTLVAIPYILRNWAFGSGMISAKWNGGFETAVGNYFHPPDIGVLGILFLYGIVGLTLYSGQFVFAMYFARQTKQVSKPNSDLIRAIVGLILFTGLRSLATAHIIYFPAPVLFGTALLWALKNHISFNCGKHCALNSRP